MKALFGIATLLLLVAAAIALSLDPLWGLLTAAAALCSGIGYFICRHQAGTHRHNR
ncbi:hypothetical protein ACIPVK_13105 [Paeniglutamicibacter sp. MACA_103]|uniref:hypothetical protein n=1 Tax=Paeniglutamicibacter sp. MACA_103 TaxID=3377337 RepID=UPI0038967B05